MLFEYDALQIWCI